MVEMHGMIDDEAVRFYSALHIQTIYRGCVTRQSIQKMNTAAIKLQRNLRRYLAQLAYGFDLMDIIAAQSIARRCIAQVIIRREHMNAIAIQRLWRGYCNRLRYGFCLMNIITTQSLARRYIAQCQFQQHRAALQVERVWRGYKARRHHSETLASIVKVQSIARCFLNRSIYQRQQKALLIVQSTTRQVLAKRLLAHAIHSVIKIQSVARARIVQRCSKTQLSALVTIQNFLRQVIAKKVLRRAQIGMIAKHSELTRIHHRRAAMTIQRCYKHRILSLFHRCATTIQRMWRGYSNRSDYRRILMNIVKLQSYARKIFAQHILIKMQSERCTKAASDRLNASICQHDVINPALHCARTSLEVSPLPRDEKFSSKATENIDHNTNGHVKNQNRASMGSGANTQGSLEGTSVNDFGQAKCDPSLISQTKAIQGHSFSILDLSHESNEVVYTATHRRIGSKFEPCALKKIDTVDSIHGSNTSLKSPIKSKSKNVAVSIESSEKLSFNERQKCALKDHKLHDALEETLQLSAPRMSPFNCVVTSEQSLCSNSKILLDNDDTFHSTQGEISFDPPPNPHPRPLPSSDSIMTSCSTRPSSTRNRDKSAESSGTSGSTNSKKFSPMISKISSPLNNKPHDEDISQLSNGTLKSKIHGAQNYSQEKAEIKSNGVLTRSKADIFKSLETARATAADKVFRDLPTTPIQQTEHLSGQRLITRSRSSSLDVRCTSKAIETIEKSTVMAEVKGAVETLVHTTRKSKECCKCFVRAKCHIMLCFIITSCNRSTPHLELLQMILQTMTNVMMHRSSAHQLATNEVAEVIIYVCQMYRDKSKLFSLSCSLLDKITTNGDRSMMVSQIVAKVTIFMDATRNQHHIVTRMQETYSTHEQKLRLNGILSLCKKRASFDVGNTHHYLLKGIASLENVIFKIDQFN